MTLVNISISAKYQSKTKTYKEWSSALIYMFKQLEASCYDNVNNYNTQ